MAGSSFTVDIHGLQGAIEVISASGFDSAAAPEVEKAVVETARQFKREVQADAPVGKGRFSQWQRKGGIPHGAFRRSVSLTSRRAGFDTTARVRPGPIANILRTGARPHVESAPRGGYLIFPGLRAEMFLRRVHHPGTRPNDFWERATATLGGIVEPLARKAGFATADKMAERINRSTR